MATDDMLETLQRIERHLDSLVRMQYAKVVDGAFADDGERKAFELTGQKTSTEICKKLKMSPNRLTDLRTKWVNMGILIKFGGGFRKVVE